MNMCLDRVHAASYKKLNSLVIASDPRICLDKIDSLKNKPSKRLSCILMLGALTIHMIFFYHRM
jgi:hypothetical protein